MKPWKCLATATAPDGGELALWQRDAELVVRINGVELMSSRRHGSEEAMAIAAESALARRGARVLIGGLGFGFTLRAALQRLASDGRLDLIEISPDIIAWNQRWLADLNGRALGDPRVTLTCGDLRVVLEGAALRGGKSAGKGGLYDAILVDVDNGPWPLAARANRLLWRPAGILAIARSLRSGGMLVVWSTGPDADFAARLRAEGFTVAVEVARAHDGSGGRHTLFVAQWRSPS
jgi:spermidine synthase